MRRSSSVKDPQHVSLFEDLERILDTKSPRVLLVGRTGECACEKMRFTHTHTYSDFYLKQVLGNLLSSTHLMVNTLPL